MTPTQREKYPAIAQALDYCGMGTHSNNFLWVILDAQEQGLPTDIHKLDMALNRLFKTREAVQLDEQLQDLFRNESEWDKAESEILALSYFSDIGRLVSVGWPTSGGYGKQRPFDGLALMDNIELPFDIKSAKNSASKWLRGVLIPIVEEWADKRWKLTIEVKISGIMTLKMIAPHKKKLIEEFRRILFTHHIIPAENIVLTVGHTKICIKIVYYGITTNRIISSLPEHASFVKMVMHDHVEKKAAMADKNNAVGFFLVYVRPPSSGTADISPRVFNEAASQLAHDCDLIKNSKLWLASVMLDWTPCEQPNIHISYNPKAAWPGHLNEKSFRASLLNICDNFLTTPKPT